MDLEIQGIRIHFPYKPYGCQLSMLNRVITALNNKQGCLLESPTGTGKTLALLCASLGWLDHQTKNYSKIVDHGDVVHDKTCALSVSTATERDDDFGEFIEDQVSKVPNTCSCGVLEEKENAENVKIPRIIYATRTHKQISQVVRELRKTKYSGTQMCILSSRKHTCINHEIRRQPNINDACQNLKGLCPFDQGKNRKNLARCVQALNRNGPWDLEDYVDMLTEVPTCPYFFAFKLFEHAPLCFCPYNYLLDPVFRETVASELAGSVIIIDEAHNIEDAAREATSVTLVERDLLAALDDLKRYLNKANVGDDLAKDVTALINLLNAIHQVMQLARPRLIPAGSFASSAQVWSGSEIGGLLSTVGLGVDRFESVRASFNRLNVKIQKASQAASDLHSGVDVTQLPNSATVRLFSYIFIMLKFLYRDDMRRLQDYRAVLKEVIDFQKQRVSEDPESPRVISGRWLSKQTGSKMRLVESKTLSLNFWCLNPAVCMSSLASNAHCLILASGTLSPLDAMAAELSLEFPVRLEATHVVPLDRVFATAISRGPLGNRLCATYANQNVFAFQDDIGHLVLEACRLVPGGVLCFFPSYGLLDKMVARWELTGLLDKLAYVKHVLVEPRSSEKFEDWISEFYEAVDSTRKSPDREVVQGDTFTGALALAVCRGKVSEGLDFVDDYGRLVIVVGIPFPAYKDPQIEQKRAFNDTARGNRTAATVVSTASPVSSSSSLQKPSSQWSPSPLKALSTTLGEQLCNGPPEVPGSSPAPTRTTTSTQCVLSGSEWYEAQAYRALNQALGRCIRHRGDWGGIVLADARFVEQPNRYVSGVSRWLRNQISSHDRWTDLSMNLADFVQRMTGQPATYDHLNC